MLSTMGEMGIFNKENLIKMTMECITQMAFEYREVGKGEKVVFILTDLLKRKIPESKVCNLMALPN